MKKIFLSILVALTGLCVFAQKGQVGAGLNFNYTPSLESGLSLNNFGLSAKLQYGLTNALRGELLVGYDFKDQGVGLFHASANLHYLIHVGDRFKFYPILGAGYALLTVDWGYFGSGSDSKFLANGGLGAEYDFSEHLTAGFEVKYQYIKDFSRLPISLGLTYKF